jgi:hypothetical protein
VQGVDYTIFEHNGRVDIEEGSSQIVMVWALIFPDTRTGPLKVS